MLVRQAQLEDGDGVHRVHGIAVRGLCTGHYSAEQIFAWVGDGTRARRTPFADVLARCTLFVAIDDANTDHRPIVGFSQVDIATREVEAVYVDPAYVRRGIGYALLHQLEATARDHALPQLHISASINAVPFYAAAGYTAVAAGSHRLNSGVEIPCMSMHKQL